LLLAVKETGIVYLPVELSISVLILLLIE
jgi:hypothetical protein